MRGLQLQWGGVGDIYHLCFCAYCLCRFK
jgi:hypothetical protein